MKRWIGIVSIALVYGLGGCKKDNTPLTEFNSKLQGTWTLDSNNMEYYDDASAKLYEEEIAVDNLPEKIIFKKGLTASIITQTESLNTGYDGAIVDGTFYLEFFNASIFNSSVWQIPLLDSKKMVWIGVYTNIRYENKETGASGNASRAVLRLYFSE